jgi:hypothetical protein
MDTDLRRLKMLKPDFSGLALLGDCTRGVSAL